MGIFSKILHYTKTNNKINTVEMLLDKYKYICLKSHTQFIFSELIKHLIAFLKKSRPEALMDNSSYENYINDSILFELTCYIAFRIDFWLYANNPEIREKVGRNIREYVINIFAEAFNTSMESIGEIFCERQGVYAEIIREGQPIDAFFAELEEMITRVSNGATPSHYDRQSPMTLLLMENIQAKAMVRVIERRFMPSVMEMMKPIVIGIMPNSYRKTVFMHLAYNDPDKGIECLEKAIVNINMIVAHPPSPKNIAEIHYLLGKCYKEKKDFKKAINELRHAIKLDENHYDAIVELAQIITDKKEIICLLRKAIKISPDRYEAYDWLYSLYDAIAMQQIPMNEYIFQYAYKLITHIIELKPFDAKLYLSRATLQSCFLISREDEKIKKQSLSDYNAATYIDPFDLQTINQAKKIQSIDKLNSDLTELEDS